MPMRRWVWISLLMAVVGAAGAQPMVRPIPLEPIALPGSEPPPTPAPVVIATPLPTALPTVLPTAAPVAAATPAPRPAATSGAVARHPAPPVLPEFPQRRAIEAVAVDGDGRMTYAGPSGAMVTSANGGTCAVTCSLSPQEEYQVSCPAGRTAFCQCDRPPYAECR